MHWEIHPPWASGDVFPNTSFLSAVYGYINLFPIKHSSEQSGQATPIDGNPPVWRFSACCSFSLLILIDPLMTVWGWWIGFTSPMIFLSFKYSFYNLAKLKKSTCFTFLCLLLFLSPHPASPLPLPFGQISIPIPLDHWPLPSGDSMRLVNWAHSTH